MYSTRDICLYVFIIIGIKKKNKNQINIVHLFGLGSYKILVGIPFNYINTCEKIYL